MRILVCLGTDFFVEIRRGVWVLKRILRKLLTLKLNLHNKLIREQRNIGIPIQNYQRGQQESWFVWELIFCGNSTGCIGVETYFA